MHLALKSRQEHFKRLCFLLFYGTHTSCGVCTWLKLSMEFLLNFITLNTLLLYKFYLQWVINIWTITVHIFFITADVVITRESCSSPYHCAIHKDYIVFSPFKFTYMVEKQEKKFMWIFLIILFFLVIFRIACSWTIIKNLVELSESNVNIYVWHLLLNSYLFLLITQPRFIPSSRLTNTFF